jgi:hypothetical protein
MDLHHFLTQQFNPQGEVVEIGDCSCKPAGTIKVYATTDDLPGDFKVKCSNGKAHKWSDVRLSLPLAHLDPTKPSKPTIKRLMRECLDSWYNSRQNTPDGDDQPVTHQSTELIRVPHQPVPPEDYEAYRGDFDEDGIDELLIILYRDLVSKAEELSKMTTRAIKRKAYQLWHLFTCVVTNPKVLTTLGLGIYAWITGDGHCAWMVLIKCIAPVLPKWLKDKVDHPIFVELSFLLGNAVSHRVFARHFSHGPGMARLAKEGEMAAGHMNLLNNAQQIQPADAEQGVTALVPRFIAWWNGNC